VPLASVTAHWLAGWGQQQEVPSSWGHTPYPLGRAVRHPKRKFIKPDERDWLKIVADLEAEDLTNLYRAQRLDEIRVEMRHRRNLAQLAAANII